MNTLSRRGPDSPLALMMVVILAVAILAGSPAEAAIYYVDDDSCPGPGSGTPADPFCSIQSGIDAASTGDTVQVAAGTYLETISMKSGVVIQGAGQGDTIIDGGGNGPVVTAIGVDSTATLDGFTITNGDAYNGGGMYNLNSSPTVSNCTFSGNSAFMILHIGDGGGMYNLDSSPTVTNCTFSGNDAARWGGGMYNGGSSPTVSNCTFSGNTAERGGGMDNEISSPMVTGCSFSGNASSQWGGGMANDDSSPTVSTCTFFDNTAGYRGGGMANLSSSSSPTVANCIFSLNHAGEYFGKDMANLGASPTVSTCTFWNEVTMIYNEGASSTTTLTNCVFGGVSDPIFDAAGAVTTVTYSVVPYPGTGNISADPMLVDPANRDFHLQPFSPCIDAGDNSDPALLATDIDGDDRRIDDPMVFDTGNGDPPIVDMGADEFAPRFSIFIEKTTNGIDADGPPGPYITVGDPVEWIYTVTNTGNITLTGITVVDDQPGVAPTCPGDVLAPQETMECGASGMAVEGQYANLGTAIGYPPVGDPVSASDPSHYFGMVASIDIEKATNGVGADDPPGPEIEVGSPVEWTYSVRNTGNMTLTGITVVDDQPGVAPICPGDVLAPQETMECGASGVAVEGQYENVGTATGTPPLGLPVADTDPSHYLGVGGLPFSDGFESGDTSAWSATVP